MGILRETKVPPDQRVPFTPEQCRHLLASYPQMTIMVQPSTVRAYSDSEYIKAGIRLAEDLSACDLLVGVKEVSLDSLLPGKKYLFFSHVGKKQAHNRKLLQEILRRKITLLDYEYLTDENRMRVVAFGRWAGIVGAYNALRGWGLKKKLYQLTPAWQCFNREAMEIPLRALPLDPLKILITGEGRVASGAEEVLRKAGLRQLSVSEYLRDQSGKACYCRIGPSEYTRHSLGNPFDFEDFVNHPGSFVSHMERFLPHTDLLITGHFWDPRSPRFFNAETVAGNAFRVSFIADISCDIGGALPTTLRSSSIRQPFYDVTRNTMEEKPAFSHPDHISVMAVDNLPAELPRDASEDFGLALIQQVIGEFFKQDSPLLNRATIARNGSLTPAFSYLEDFVKE